MAWGRERGVFLGGTGAFAAFSGASRVRVRHLDDPEASRVNVDYGIDASAFAKTFIGELDSPAFLAARSADVPVIAPV